MQATSPAQSPDPLPIDRRALVSRHNVVHRSAAPEHFLQVGNGEFAFAFDVTGMQTIDRAFEQPIPLHTMSNWGWHSFPNVNDFRYEQTLSEYPVGNRTVTYADKQSTPSGAYFRANSHRLNLARVSLWWPGQDDAGATAADLRQFAEIEQSLDLWTGVATSRFKFRGQPVTVVTVAHPERDAVAFRIESPLLASEQLGVAIRFSYPLGQWGPSVDDFSREAAHISAWRDEADGGLAVERTLDDWNYGVAIRGEGLRSASLGAHGRRLCWPDGDPGELTVEFTPGSNADAVRTSPPSFAELRDASALHWLAFWTHGGALDLSETRDPRVQELERRVVLSQYLTAIQNGSLPPQESGLVCNSWFGKQHVEMHWWHAAHFALWGREELLERSLEWYARILPQAQAIARRQGYAGARWPKMTGPGGVSSPSGVGEFLVWQQPHIIYLAELVHRATPTPATLARYGSLIDATAAFMADFVEWDSDGRRCHLGPPVIPAQENYKPTATRDPTFELVYWHWALSTAQTWRERQGRARNAEWDRVLAGLARPHIRDGRYAAVGTPPPFTNTSDHPSMLAAYGVLPATPLIDPETMLRTARWVDGAWQWDDTWGWDFPMCAMTYARCGDPEAAVAALLRDTPKNRYLPNGHNYQEPRLPVYLPGNGGILAATAMMAAGWDGAPPRPAPGFPADWKVRYEGLRPLP